jgi:MFS family permease
VLAGPASQLIIHDIVGPTHLPSAVRLNATSRHLAILLGPAVGGGLMLLLGPANGLLANVLIYLPLTVFLLRMPYTGHARHGDAGPRRAPRLGLGDVVGTLAAVRDDRRIMTMILLGGVTSFFVGNAFQAQMPEYAHDLGADEAGAHYSALLAGNATGAVLGAVLLETLGVLRPSPRLAIVCAGAWAVTMALFAVTGRYGIALALLVVAGVFNIAFTSMAQTLVQVLAPPAIRGRVVGLFSTALLGLRAGSGVTVGVLGALVNVHWSLALSASAVAATAVVLLVRQRRAPHEPLPR